MQSAGLRLFSELLALGEDVGVGDDSFNTHLLHLGRRDNLQMRVDNREKSRSFHHLVACFEFSNASGDVFVDYFKCYCHISLLGEYLSFEGFDDTVVIFPCSMIHACFDAGLGEELFRVPMVFLCNLGKKESGTASKLCD